MINAPEKTPLTQRQHDAWRRNGADPQGRTASRPTALELLEHQPLDVRLTSLCRMAESPSVFERLTAYRGLAGLYLLDLRYEQRAKRVIVAGLKREQGVARERVQQLLRRC